MGYQLRRKRRRKRRGYALQILWTIVALVSIAGIIIGYKIGFGDTEDGTSPIANAADHPSESSETEGELLTQISEIPTKEPNEEITVTEVPTVKPTAKPTATPTEKPTIAPSNQKMIALTFDDGPYPPVTERIVETLKKYDARVTFFAMGNRMEEYKSTVELAFEGGNQIASHTYSHKDLSKLSVKEIKYEVEHSNECINNVVPAGDTYLRVPFGVVNDLIIENVGAPIIFWSVDTEDWKSRNADKIYKHIMKNAHDGDIVIMHDLYPSTADAMEKVIPKLIEEGYQLVTVKELLEAKGIEVVNGNVYYSARQ